MRLLVDARTGWGHGIGRVIASTVPRVAALRPDWHLKLLVPPRHVEMARAAFGDASNVAIEATDIRPFSMAEQIHLSKLAVDCDLTWFTNYWVPLAWTGPFVTTVHDMLHQLPHYAPSPWHKRTLSLLTFHKARRQAAAVMFDSRFTEHEFIKMIGKPRGVAETVALGGDHLAYGELRPLKDRSRRMLVVAAAKGHKNFERLFRAFQAADVSREWTLTVISPREFLLNSIDLDAAAGLDSRIDLRRGISNEELSALYADSAIVLMPSHYEGFGLPLLEGMLAGAFCISSSAGSLVEIAQGAFVHFVNSHDTPGWSRAMEEACRMIEDGTSDLDAIAAHNLACARAYRWDATAAKAVAVLERAMEAL